MSSHRKTGLKKLRIEALEGRLLMAGNITASLKAGNHLFIWGDASDNGVMLSSVAGEYVVQGFSVTDPPAPTTVNGKNEPKAFANVRKVSINLGAGTDVLQLGNHFGDQTVFSDNLILHASPGDKGVVMDNVLFAKPGGAQVTINTGAGADHISLNGVSFQNGSPKLALNSGKGGDIVSAMNVSFTAGGLSRFGINTGSGDDAASASNVSFNSEYRFTVNTGLGNDSLALQSVRRPAIGRYVVTSVAMGRGNDQVIIRDSVFHKLSVNLDRGEDELFFADNAVFSATLDGGPSKDSLNPDWKTLNTGAIAVKHFETFV